MLSKARLENLWTKSLMKKKFSARKVALNWGKGGGGVGALPRSPTDCASRDRGNWMALRDHCEIYDGTGYSGYVASGRWQHRKFLA